MTSTASASSPPSLLPQAAVPLRSPRTSIVLAELARQRRLERQQRRLKRQRRRQAWAQVTAWLHVLGRRPLEAMRTHPTPGLPFPESVPLAYALRPL